MQPTRTPSSAAPGRAGRRAGRRAPTSTWCSDTLQTMDAQTAEGTAALTAPAVQESDATPSTC